MFLDSPLLWPLFCLGIFVISMPQARRAFAPWAAVVIGVVSAYAGIVTILAHSR